MGTFETRGGPRPFLRSAGALVAAYLALSACARAQGRRFTVRVENEEGLPLAGAHVEADVTHDLLYFGRFEGCVATELARGETGRDGTFRFTASTRGMPQRQCPGATVHVMYQDWPDHHSSYFPEAGELDQAFERPPFATPVPTESDGSTTLRVRLGPAATAHGTVRWHEQPGARRDPGSSGSSSSTSPRGCRSPPATRSPRQCERVARRELARGAAGALLLDLTTRDSDPPAAPPPPPPFSPR
jgi:hypothetical protein